MIRLIQTDYTATEKDYYLGVDSELPVTITLPAADDGTQYIIKSEMKPPMGKRKIRIIAADGSKFDGYSDHTLHVSHDCLWVIRRGDEWHIISK